MTGASKVANSSQATEQNGLNSPAQPTHRPARPNLTERYHRFVEKYVLRVPPRSPNPYATHLPVLLALGRRLPIRSVLELGCGEHSTLAFLDRNCFPQLERLDSYENAVDWAKKILERAAGDLRLRMNFVEGTIEAAASGCDLEAYDLIFADDSTAIEQRTATIRALARRQPERPVLVMHDFEQPPYREAAEPFRRRYRFTGLSPNTGAAWNGDQLKKFPLGRLNGIMRRQRVRGKFDTGDRSAWLRWLELYGLKRSL